MRLASGTLWPIPVTLAVPDDLATTPGSEFALRDAKHEILAVLRVEDVFEWDRRREAERVLGKADPAHPLVGEMERWGARCVSGPLRVLRLPQHVDFRDLRLTPVRGPGAPRGARPPGRRGVPDAEPDAPEPRGADEAGRGRVRRDAPDSPRRRPDEAGRRRPHHARPGLHGARPGSTTTRRARSSRSSRSRCGWRARAKPSSTPSSGGTTARTASSSGGTTRGRAPAPTESPSSARTTRRRCSRRHADEIGVANGPVPRDGLPPRRGPLRGGRPPAEGGADALDLRDAGPGRLPREGEGPAGLVHAARDGRHPPPDVAAEGGAGLLRLVHRALGLREVDDRRARRGPPPRAGAPRHAPGRRRREDASLEGAGLFPRGPRHEHPPHRVRRLRDRPPQRRRGLRRDQPLPPDARRVPGDGGRRAASSRSSSTRRSTSAKRATRRGCTRRRGPES